MAKWQFEGVDRYIAQLQQLGADTEEMCGKAIYKGAGLVADALRSSINGLTTDDGYHPPGEMRNGPTTEEKQGLLDGFGISKMRQDGTMYNVKIGFSGRNPNGLMNSGVARQIESGTSWMTKQPFINRTVNSKKRRCEEVMMETLDEEIKNLMQ